MEIAERLEKLAWHEYSRGRACCAQVAWKLALEAREQGWVAIPEKMTVTKEN